MWVPTITTGTGRVKLLQLTNLSDKVVTLDRGPALGWIMAADMVPRYPGYGSVGSQRYNEWQTLSFEATPEREKEMLPAYAGPHMDHPTYPTPKKVMSRPTGNIVLKDNPIREEKVVPRVDPLPRVVNTTKEKERSVRAPGRPMEDVATNNGAGDPSKQEAGSSPGVTIDKDPAPDNDRIAGEPDGSTYCHESG